MKNVERISLKVFVRESVSKNYTRSLRRDGFTPSVIHKKLSKTIHIFFESGLEKKFGARSSSNLLFDLSIQDYSKRNILALIRDIQYHPLTESLQHVDFISVCEEDSIKLKIPVVFLNKEESPGLKRGGKFKIIVPKLYISCQVKDLKENLTVDLSNSDIGSFISTDKIELPYGMKLLSSKEDIGVIATITSPQVSRKETSSS